MRYIFLIILAMLTACSAGKNNGARDPHILIRLTDSDARGLDPQMVGDISSVRITSDLFEGLTRFNAAGDAEPGLADQWEISSDGKTWTFHLRNGLQFSDGHPITADVFAKSLARIRDPKSGSPHGALFAIIKNINVLDPRSLQIVLEYPFPQLPALLSHPAMAALPWHQIEALGDAWSTQRPLVTSGAYVLTDWKLNQKLTLTANPHWHSGQPAMRDLIWKPVDNMQTSMRMMLAGDGDTNSDFPANRLDWLQARYPAMVHNSAYLGTYYFVFNTRKAPFNDVRVRRALSMAVDRLWIAEKMMGAGNAPAWGLLPPSLAGGNGYRPNWADWPQQQKLSVAKDLLRQAGYGAGHVLRFEIRFNSSAEHRRAAVAMATMWRAIGVDAKLLNSESSLHFDSLKRGDFAFARSGWIADLPAPENFLSVHRSDAGVQNYSGFHDAAYDGALDSALAEPDSARRLAKMRVAETMLMADAPILPLYYYMSRTLVSPRVKGWQDNVSNVHPSYSLRIEGP